MNERMKVMPKKRQQHRQPATMPPLDAEGNRLVRKGKRLYETKLKTILEPAYKGMFAAIEVDSGEYFLGTSILEAIDKAELKYPDKEVYVVRVGFPVALSCRYRMHV